MPIPPAPLWIKRTNSIANGSQSRLSTVRGNSTTPQNISQKGINPNTAPPHVLGLLFSDDGADLRFADEEQVRQILEIRQEGGFVCGDDQSGEGCTPMREIVTNAIYPPPSYRSAIFTITAEARVGDVRRSIEAILDRESGAEPLLLSWRVL